MYRIRSERYLRRSLTYYTISGVLYQCKVTGRCLVNVVYASDLTVMLFAVWSQGASGKKKMRSLRTY